MILVDKRITKKGIIKFLSILALIVLGLVFLCLINYSCPIHKFLKIYCPGCGGTRMLIEFFKGNFYQSFRWNPLLFIWFVILLIYFISFIIIYIKKKVLLVPSRKLLVFIVVTLLLFMILRNIELFSYLIPTEV